MINASYCEASDILYVKVGRKWTKGILLTIDLGHGIYIDVDTKNRFRGFKIFDALRHFKPDELQSIQGGGSWMPIRAAIAYVAREGDVITVKRMRRLIADGVITAKRDGSRHLVAMHTLLNYLSNRPDAQLVSVGEGFVRADPPSA